MKSIAIVTRGMMLGGIERALISMLNNIDYTRYKVDLFIVESGGELEKEIPKEVKIKYIYEKRLRDSIVESIKSFNIANLFNLITIGINLRVIKNKYKLFRFMTKKLPNIEEVYDVAVAYHNPITFPTAYVIDKLIADKKVMWIHSDINQYSEIVDDFIEYYEKYDAIFGVSNGVIKQFLDRYPNLQSKCNVYYNYISKKEIIKKCDKKKYSFDNANEINILTVGRLSCEKGIDKIPEIAKKLIEDNCRFKWYIIGDGPEKNKVFKLINNLNVEDNVILLGNKKNPYNYMRDCDIYVQTSTYESYCLTVAEAKCFEKPIVSTRVIGVIEQIENGKNGILVDDDIDKIYKEIKSLINNRKVREQLSENLSNECIDTTGEFKKFESYLLKDY